MTQTAGTLVDLLAACRLCLTEYAIPDRCHWAGYLESPESLQRRGYFFSGHSVEAVLPRVADVVCQGGDFFRGQGGEWRHAPPTLVDAADNPDSVPEPVIAAQCRERGRIPEA